MTTATSLRNETTQATHLNSNSKRARLAITTNLAVLLLLDAMIFALFFLFDRRTVPQKSLLAGASTGCPEKAKKKEATSNSFFFFRPLFVVQLENSKQR